MTKQNDPLLSEVLTLLERITGKPGSAFKLSDDLVRDLRISSDDLSFYFIPELQERLGVTVPVSEWRSVATISETCDLLRKYLPGYAAHRISEGGWRVVEKRPDGTEIPIADFVSYKDAMEYIHWKLGVPPYAGAR
jgi:hypothetical protein